MSSPTASGMKALFPQFAGKADSALEVWFDQALLRWTPARFGSQWAMAVYLFTAHQLATFDPDAASSAGDHISRGPVTAESILDQSRSYGATFDMGKVPPSLQWLTSTSYGQQLIGIIQSRSAMRGFVVLTGSSRSVVGS